MPYLGNPPAEAYTSTVKDSFSGDGSTTAFTLSQPSTTNDLRVVVENVIQDPTVAYSVSGTTLTFTSAPPTGTNNVYAVNLGPAVQTVVPPDGVTLTNPTVTGQVTVNDTIRFDTTDTTVSTNDVFGDIEFYDNDGGSAGAGVTAKIQATAASTYGASQIIFSTSSSSGGARTALTEAARFNNVGNLVFPNGQGIDFSASAGSGSTSSLLDDYEEGTFQTNLSPATSGTITIQSTADTLAYTKIGRLVTITGMISVTSTGSAVGSFVLLNNLPFTSADLTEFAGRGAGYVVFDDDSAGTRTPLGTFMLESSTQMRMYINAATVAGSDNFNVSFSYTTS